MGVIAARTPAPLTSISGWPCTTADPGAAGRAVTRPVRSGASAGGTVVMSTAILAGWVVLTVPAGTVMSTGAARVPRAAAVSGQLRSARSGAAAPKTTAGRMTGG